MISNEKQPTGLEGIFHVVGLKSLLKVAFWQATLIVFMFELFILVVTAGTYTEAEFIQIVQPLFQMKVYLVGLFVWIILVMIGIDVDLENSYLKDWWKSIFNTWLPTVMVIALVLAMFL